MEESVTYQAILRKGAVIGEAQGRRDEALRVIRMMGGEKFGPADAASMAALAAIEDTDRLERICKAVLRAPTWPDLLATP
jgi:hypothetical protein